MTKVRQSSAWFVLLGDRGVPRVRLVCFPSAGSGTSSYGRWATMVPSDVELLAVQLPGHETRLREPLIRDLHVIADQVASELESVAELPTVFFGHSMGALIAFEVAKRLRGSVAAPGSLVVSARIAPHLIESREPFGELDDEAFIDAIGQRYGGLPALLREDAEFRELYLPPLRADVMAVSAYTVRDAEPLDCPIHALGGIDDVTTPRAGLDAWREHTSSEFTLQIFPGGHFFVQSARADVVALVSRELDAVGRPQSEKSIR